jgi:hypothetical protein
MSRLRRSWAVPVFWALGLMIIGAARAEPVTITFLHTTTSTRSRRRTDAAASPS